MTVPLFPPNTVNWFEVTYLGPGEVLRGSNYTGTFPLCEPANVPRVHLYLGDWRPMLGTGTEPHDIDRRQAQFDRLFEDIGWINYGQSAVVTHFGHLRRGAIRPV